MLDDYFGGPSDEHGGRPADPSAEGYRRRSHRKPEKQAKTLTEEQLQRVIQHTRKHCNAPLSAELKVLLSFRAGLRAAEIAALPISALCDADGRIAKVMAVPGNITKNGEPRRIPIHPDLRDAAQRFREQHPDVEYVAFSCRYEKRKRQNANAVSIWFWQLYRDVGLEGCSSHSGRRTFLTQLARHASTVEGASLRDVQRIAGHARLDTTERYIDPSEDVSALINSLGRTPKDPKKPQPRD